MNKYTIRITALLVILTGLSLFTVFYDGKNRNQTAPEEPSLPLETSFQVSATGDATWAYQLEVPPGTNQVQPQLSLEYLSGGSNGLLGEGFDLRGMSQISRTGATMARDGFKGGVSYEQTDRFSIDGQRLMLVQGNAYGADQSVYHTQIETWTKVQSVGQSGSGPQSFRVWTKKGLYCEYGNTSDSRTAAVGQGFTSGNKAGSVREWLINKVSDLNGNTLTVSYTQNPKDTAGNLITVCSGQGVSYPDRIDYSSNTGQSPLRSVHFIYETRPDSATSWLGGGYFSMRARLREIQTWVKDADGDSLLIRKYCINYQSGTPLNVSRIASLLVRAGETAYKPVSFDWTEGTNTLIGTPVSWNGPGTNDGLVADFNGDGRTDLLTYNTNMIYLGADSGFSSGTNCGIYMSTSRSNFISDFNGDGISDLLVAGNTSGTIYYYQNGKFNSNGQPVNGLQISSGCYPGKCVWQGDFNGDGLGDIASYMSGSGYFNFGNKTNGLNAYVKQSNMKIYQGNTFAADFTGDGLTDLFSCNSSTGYLSVSNFSDSTGFRSAIEIENMNFVISSTAGKTWVADFNGDGMADILAKGSDSKFRLYYATGSGFSPGQIISNIDGSVVSVWPADYNNDLQMDFFAAGSSSGKIYLSNGTGFSPQQEISSAFNEQYTWLGDFDGDGQADLFDAYRDKIWYGGNSNTPHAHYNQQANYITGIRNGVGLLTKIQYKPITDSTVYTSGAAATPGVEGLSMLNEFSSFPLSPVQNNNNSIISIQSALYVVYEWNETDSAAIDYSWNYRYSGAAYDMSGYGFLGFHSVKQTDHSQGSVSVNWYLQNFPFTGQVDSTGLYSLNGEKFSLTKSKWISQPLYNSSVYQVLNAQTDVYQYYNTGTSHTNQKLFYDYYGNCRLAQSVVNVNDPQLTWTRYDFSNDTVNWQIGYPILTVQSADSSGQNPLAAVRYYYNNKRNVDSFSVWFSQDNSWLTQSFIYDQFGNQTVSIGYSGDSSFVYYDSLYHTWPVKEISPRNEQGLCLTGYSRYEPAYGNKIWTKDVNGHEFTSTFNALGEFRKMIIPDSSGNPFDAIQAGNLPAAKGYIQYSVFSRNWNKSVLDTAWNYTDALGRIYQTQQRGWSGEMVIQQTAYNSNNQTVASSLPCFSNQSPVWSRYYYDAAARLVRQTYPFETGDSITDRLQYGPFQLTLIHASGTADSVSSAYAYTLYNSNKKVKSFTNQSGQTSFYTWDLLGRINQATDPTGIKTAASWNSVNQNNWYYSFGSDTLYFDYSPKQNRFSTRNALHQTIQYSYDQLGRLVQVVPDGAPSEKYEYDLSGFKNGLGNLCRVTLDGGKSLYAFGYDQLGNTVNSSVTLDGHNWIESSAFNPDLSMAALVFPDHTEEILSYNSSGQLQLVQRKKESSTNDIVRVNNVNASGEWLSYDYANNTSNSKSYYSDGLLKAYKTLSATGAPLITKTLDWGKDYRIHSLADSLNQQISRIFRYDPTGRLIHTASAIENDTLIYDPSGNLVQNDSVVFSYTGYQVKSGIQNSDTCYKASYDACGHLLTRTVKTNGRTVTNRYSWDVFGRMDSVYRNDTLIYSFTYDFNGIRNRKRDEKTKTVTYSLLQNFCSVIDAGGNEIQTNNFSGGGIIFAGFTNDTATYFHYDQNGSLLLTTNSQGQAGLSFEYSAFGEKAVSGTGNQSLARYQFNGKEWDEDAGLYYFSSRYYDPFTGRFVSPDDQLGGDLLSPDALNNYAFVRNNPISYSDPSGHTKVGTEAEKAVLDAGIVITEVVADILSDGTLTGVEAELDASIIVSEETVLETSTAEEVAGKTVTESTEEVKPGQGKPKRKLDDFAEDNNDLSEQGDTKYRKPKRKAAINADLASQDQVRRHGTEEISKDEGDDYVEIKLNGKKVTVPRPGFRANVIQTVWDNSKDASGRVFCPNSHKELFWKSGPRTNQWHMGHRTGYEYKHLYKAYHENRITWQEVIEQYNDPSHYQAEDPDANRSHGHESKKSSYWFDLTWYYPGRTSTTLGSFYSIYFDCDRPRIPAGSWTSSCTIY